MDLMGYVAFISIGIVLGLLVGGGSILTIPILVYLFRLDAVTASAYSLFIVGITSLVGAIPKYREHLVDLRTSVYFGMPSIVSIFITRKWIVPAIPEVVITFDRSFVVTKREFILSLFAGLMILASVSMLLNRKLDRDNQDRHFSPWVIAEGLVIGLLTGVVGAGGGFLIIPALVLLTGLKFKTAVGTSLLIIGINSLFGFLGDVLNYSIDWVFLLSFSTLSIAGILIGTRLSSKISVEKLRRGFAFFVLITGAWILFREIYLAH